MTLNIPRWLLKWSIIVAIAIASRALAVMEPSSAWLFGFGGGGIALCIYDWLADD